MVLEAFVHIWKRYRPQEGWLSPFLMLAVVIVLIMTVLAVGWVPEDGVIIPAAVLGLLMGLVLARRPLATWAAWTFIIIYGFLITTLTLGNLWPPLHLLFSDWPELRLYWLNNGALFLDRAGSWFTAVFSGSRSNETIVFALLMGLLAWFLAAYAGWSAYRQRRPLLGLTLMGLIVAINGYFGAAPIESIITFVGVALLATAVLHFSNLEYGWRQHDVDYSSEIRLEMLVYAAGIGFALLALAFLLPSLNPSKLALAILGQPAVANLEQTLDRAFAGVEPPRGQSRSAGQVGGTGIMPRSFLLGNPPELEKNIMLTAETELIAGPESANLILARHWRALSYELYTGQGWSLSDESTEVFAANETIPLPPVENPMLIEQSVNWRFDNRVIRYTLGLPLSFDQPVTASWRGHTDFVRAVTDDIPRYNAISRVSAATPDQMRKATIEEIPPAISARYTQLPDDIPTRIQDLALEVSGDASTPYDQALAIERFLRQYNYSLDVELPPAGVDPVDYFLFDLQEGYCDYYASSMVVMARAMDMPARIATGFLVQPADENGVQTVRQINAHSWAEIYFAGYGWVEFEPTAAFVTPHDPLSAEAIINAGSDDEPLSNVESIPIPERAPRRPFPWSTLALILFSIIIVSTILWWLARRPRPGNEVEWAFNRLLNNARRLGHPLPLSQTPDEFNASLSNRLNDIGTRPRLMRLVDSIRSPITQLTALFVQQQYSGKPVQEPKRAVSLWRRIRRPMWILWLNKHLRRNGDS
jgi:transglutaminase-like putative cysteine protease